MSDSARDQWRELKEDHRDLIKEKIKTKADFGPLLDKWEDAEDWKLKTFKAGDLMDAIGIYGDLFFAASEYMEQLGYKDIPHVPHAELWTGKKRTEDKYGIGPLGMFLATYRYESLEKMKEAIFLAKQFDADAEWKFYKRVFDKYLSKAKISFDQGFGPAIREYWAAVYEFRKADSRDVTPIKATHAELKKVIADYIKKIVSAKMPTLVETLLKMCLENAQTDADALLTKYKIKL